MTAPRLSRRVVAAVATFALGLFAGVLPAAPAVAGPRGEQWYLDQIHVERAHAISRGEGVTIGLITNALPVGHPDLEGRVLPTMRLARGLRDSVEKAPADYPMDDPRATSEMGLMVARGGTGLLGVAPAAKVRPIICPGLVADANACVRWLVDDGVKVINFSYPTLSAFDSSFDGIRYALSKDVVVVMALADGIKLPAAQRAGVLLVGGLGRDGKLQSTVEIDTRVTVRAPGTFLGAGDDNRIVGLDPRAPDGSGYGNLFSFGADHVAAALTTGVVALVRARYPELNAASVVNRVLMSATDAGNPGKDPGYGYGVIDAEAALTKDVPETSANPLGDPGPPDSSSPRLLVIIAVGAACLLFCLAVGAIIVIILIRRRRGTR